MFLTFTMLCALIAPAFAQFSAADLSAAGALAARAKAEGRLRELERRAEKALERGDRAELAALRRDFEALLADEPANAAAHAAFGSFVYELHEEDEGVAHWEKARELDPSQAEVWNLLANHYGHRSPVRKSFEYYERAAALAPKEPVYWWNWATTVFLFRVDARAYYGIDEQAVFDKALALYGKASALLPLDFELAVDVAKTFYGITPPRHEAALAAWERALPLAPDERERQQIHLHLARILIAAGRPSEARLRLDLVTDPALAALKERLLKKLPAA